MTFKPASRVLVPLALVLLSQVASAQGFPARPITLVHPFGAGSGADQNVRLIGEEFARFAGVPLVIDPKPGGNGVIAVQAVARAAPDGYTVMLSTSSTQIFNALLYKDTPVNPLTALTPVVGLTKAYQTLVVTPGAPYATVAELLAAARKNELTFGSGTTAMRMGGELFCQLAGVKLINVPYKTTPAAVTDLLGGRIDMLFLDLVFARPLIQSGKLRPLAVTSLQRLSALPNVPTLEEAGLQGYENAFFSGIFAPQGTPQPLLARLAELFAKANAGASVEKNRASASMVEMPLNGAELARYQQSEFERWKTVVAKAGIIAE